MRPKQHETTGSADLFRARLEQIINMKHELVVFPANREFYREFCKIAASGPPETHK